MGAQSERVLSAPPAEKSAIWLGPQQAAALVHLAAVAPLRLVVGPHSSGKSTILAHLPRVMSETVALPVAGPQETAAGVLATLLRAAGLGGHDHSEIGQRNVLVAFFQRLSLAGKRILLCVDNVTSFAPAAWREIERLRLLRIGTTPVVGLAIAAEDEETAKLPLRALLRGNTVSTVENTFCLAAPTDKEVTRYLAWQLAKQRSAMRFSSEASRLINRLSLGRFGAINVFCQYLQLSEPGTRVVDGTTVRRSATALAALRRKTAKSQRREPKRVTSTSGGESPCNRLRVAFKDTFIREVPLSGRLMIGSADDSDLQLLGRFVSRHHALIVPTGADGSYYVADLNSEHGVSVNGKAVDRGVLGDGDVIGVGPFRIKVLLDRARSSRPVARPKDAGDTEVRHSA